MNEQPFFGPFEKNIIHSIIHLGNRLSSPDIYFAHNTLEKLKTNLIETISIFVSETQKNMYPADKGRYIVDGYDERNNNEEARKRFDDKCIRYDKQLIEIRNQYIQLIQYEIKLL